MVDLRENEWYGDTLVSVDELRAENKQLRIMLALAYSDRLYTDDGEFSCGKSHPSIDFKRMSVEEIKQCQRRRSEITFAQLSKGDVEEIFNRR